jgi:Protein of unknown function (DUF2845)
MQVRHLVFLSGMVMFAASPAAAESLRCQGGIVAEGDSRLSLIHKCGQPQLKDQFCAAVFYKDPSRKVSRAVAHAHVPCVPTELWLYERGPGNLVATVRIQSGAVQSIAYGHVPE